MLSGSAILESFTSYVPALILRRLAFDSSALPLPHADAYPGAILFADISGFTALTERLAEHGRLGVEELTQMLNDYFGHIIDVVALHGGDVVKFAGDALLALWQAGDDSEDLSLLTLRAAQCALSVQERLAGYRGASGERLALRVAIGAGDVRSIHLGGVFGRCEFVVSGEPVAQAGEICKYAGLGEAVIAARAWSLIQSRCAGDPLPQGPIRLREVRGGIAPRSLRLPALNRDAGAAVRGYIPAAVRSRLEAGQTGWLSEVRQVTVLFLNLPDLNYNTPLDQAQAAMCELQQALYRYEGSINKLSVDDKGITLVAALGLPPLAHENDPVRGVRAALAMWAKLKSLGWASSIGVSTGRAFCGAYGSAIRREYTMIGDVVNLSARLMQAAKGGILCDEATHRAARTRLHFDALPPVTVKGKTGLVPIYRPDGSAERAADAEGQELAGRKAEREVLAERLRVRTSAEREARSAERTDSVRIPVPADIGSVVFIEGDAGIGKSRLVADLLWQARGTGLTVLTGSGDAVEKSTPYYAWRAVFQLLLHLDGVPDEPDAIRQHVLNQLEGNPQLLAMAPLLAVAVKGDWPDNDFTAQMTGETRADNTNRLLAHLLSEASATAPLLLVLEDVQWLDTPSWALARLVVREVNPVLLVLSARPLGDNAPADLVHLRGKPGTLNMRLEMLSPDETAELMRQRLGVHSIPAEAAALVHEKAQGNPLFVEELTYALREAQIIGVFGEECRLTAGPERLRNFNVPDTVQGVVTSRVDRLTPPQQLALKVASVVGRVFPFRLMSAVYPIESDRASLAGLLEDLVRLELVHQEACDPELVYAFKNVITREVVYGLMLEMQRRQLHQEVAGWYERIHASDLMPYYPLLAHHWARAEFAGKAIVCLEKAGELALHSYANEEAIGFFSEALLLTDKLTAGEPGKGGDNPASAPSASITGARKASWQRQLGEAYYALGNMGKSLGHFQEALVLLGLSVPRSRLRLALQTLRELGRQLLHRAWPWLFLGRRRGIRETLLEAARAYERLAQIHYLDDARLACFHSAFRTLNLAESAGTSPELARAYANASILNGLLSMHGTARAHAERARKTAAEVNLVPCSTYVYEVVGIYWYGVGDWIKAKETLGEARALAERIGDMRRWDEILFPWSMIPAHQGDFARGRELAAQMYDSAKRRGIVQVQSWGLSWELACLLPLNQRDKEVSRRVEELMHGLESLLADHSVPSGALVRADEVLGHGLVAKARWRRSEVELALRSAGAAAKAGAGSDPTSHYVLAGYAGMAEVYLGMWEAGHFDAILAEEMAAKVRPICKTLHTFARMHPVGHPLAWLYQGLAYQLGGKPRKARGCWSESLSAAERLTMPYEQGLAHYELGRWAERSDPQRLAHLNRALELFKQTGAKHDQTLTEKALGAQG